MICQDSAKIGSSETSDLRCDIWVDLFERLETQITPTFLDLQMTSVMALSLLHPPEDYIEHSEN